MEKMQARNMSPVVLAYMGDTVYESFVREYLINKNNICRVNDLHKNAVKFVKAKSQAKAVLSLEEELSDEESYIVKEAEIKSQIRFQKMQIQQSIDMLLDLKLWLGIYI